MAEIIKEIDWNGKHYTFTNNFYRTGTKSHDILIMEDEDGNSWTGETTWINRPWHRFDLEEAFDEIVGKAFGQKALELVREIDKDAYSVEQVIEEFFAKFDPKDITLGTHDEEAFDTSEEGRRRALANYLEVSPEIIESNGYDNEFTVDGETYKVLTDDEADEEFENYCRNLWDELGLDIGDYITDSILEYAVDEGELEDVVREDIESYVYEMDDEEVADECVNEGIVSSEEVYDEESDSYNPELKDDVDFDDLRTKLIEEKMSDIDNYGDYLRNMGFDSNFFKNYIDEDKAVEIIMDAEGVNGNGRGIISYYDGAELELDSGLYAYRID